MAADEQQQETDELVLRDLPGKLGILVLAVATAALVWELFGVLFQSGWPFIRPLDSGDVIGVALFATGWAAILVGLLVLRRRRT